MGNSFSLTDRHDDTIEIDGPETCNPMGHSFISITRGRDEQAVNVYLSPEQLYQVYIAIGDRLASLPYGLTFNTDTQRPVELAKVTGEGDATDSEFLERGDPAIEKSRSVTVIENVGEVVRKTIHTVKYRLPK